MRNLTERQAEAALGRGAGIEQMLTGSLSAGTVEWLSAAPTFRGIELRRFKVLDEGNDGFLDVHEFRPLDEDEYRGEGVLVGHFSRARELLDHAVGKGARLDRWVNKGAFRTSTQLSGPSTADHSSPARMRDG